MLQEVELFVLRRRPEVLTFVAATFFFQLAFFVDDRDAAFLAERWIGEDKAEAIARITGQRVGSGVDRARVRLDAGFITHSRAVLGTSSQPWAKPDLRCRFWSLSMS